MHKIDKCPAETTSLSRVWRHTQDTNIGVITAFQGENTLQENRQRNSALASAIAARFGYIKVKGRFVEGYGTPEAHIVDEESLLVIGNAGPDSGNLLGFLRRQGEKYGQDSILFKPYDNEDSYLHGTNRDKPDRFPGYGVRLNLGPWHPNRMSEFHTVMFRGKTLTSEGVAATRVDEVIGFYRQRTFFSRQEGEF